MDQHAHIRHRWLLAALACCISVSAVGCAVTEPTDTDTERVRSALEADTATTIASLGKQLGVSDAAVIRALPASMRREIARPMWSQVLAEMSGWGTIQLRWQDGPQQVVYLAERFDLAYPSPDMYLVTDDRFTLTLRPAEIEGLWLIDRPTETGDQRGLIICDDQGHARFWFLLVDETSPAFGRAWQAVD